MYPTPAIDDKAKNDQVQDELKDEDIEGLKEEFRADGDENPHPKPTTTTVAPHVKEVDEEMKGLMTKLMGNSRMFTAESSTMPKRNSAPSKRIKTKPFLGSGAHNALSGLRAGIEKHREQFRRSLIGSRLDTLGTFSTRRNREELLVINLSCCRYYILKPESVMYIYIYVNR